VNFDGHRPTASAGPCKVDRPHLGAALPRDGRSPCYYHGMRGWVDPLLSIIAAIATALLLALIARDDVGMPPGMVREDALIGASVMIAAVAGMSSRKRKQ
jgi:hypothetical protein